jgi:integrase
MLVRHHNPIADDVATHAIVATAISDLRLRRSVAHRSGQSGCVTRKNGFYVVRFRQDVPGQSERVLRSVRICPIKGLGSLTKTQREFRAKQIVQQSGADDLGKVRETAAANRTVTFAEQSERWLHEMQNRKRDPVKPRTLGNWKSHIAWLLPRVGDIPLADLTPAKANQLITAMAKEGLSAKTIKNYFGVFTQVIASAKNDKGEELYPYKWDPAFLDLPKVTKRKQRRPTFTADVVEKIISLAMPREAMLYALLAGTGLRVGEALGLEVQHFVDDSLNIEQSLWNGKTFSPKTDNGVRPVDLPHDLAQKLRQFIGVRRTGYIFQAENGSALHQSNLLRRRLHPILKGLGIEKQGFHGFRRFRITHLRKQRVAEDLVRLWAGHSNQSVTDGYVKVSDDEGFRRSAVEQAGLGFRLELLQLFPSVPHVSLMTSSPQMLVV